jgi:hypothetical protein
MHCEVIASPHLHKRNTKSARLDRLSPLLTLVVWFKVTARADGAVLSYLNFDSGGGDSFRTQLNLAADEAGLGADYFSVADAGTISGLVKSKMESHFSGFDVSFTTAPAAGATPISFADTGGGFGLATFDRRAAFFSPGSKLAKVFSGNFDPTLSSVASKSVNIERIAVGLSGTASHELAHTFGLDHHDAYGVPGIHPGNYADTMGLQNTQLMATGPTGLPNDRSTARAFGKLELAKLEIASGVGPAVPAVLAETGLPHATPATAQEITFAALPISGMAGRVVAGASISGPPGVEEDWYKFTASAGTPLTAEVFSYVDHVSPFFFDSINSTVMVYKSDGVTAIAFADDLHYLDDNFTPTATKRALNSFILNLVLPDRRTRMAPSDGVRRSHASPTAFIARIISQLESNCHHRRPCRALEGNAWWLLCHPSPSARIAQIQLLALWSVV